MDENLPGNVKEAEEPALLRRFVGDQLFTIERSEAPDAASALPFPCTARLARHRTAKVVVSEERQCRRGMIYTQMPQPTMTCARQSWRQLMRQGSRTVQPSTHLQSKKSATAA